MSLPLTMKEFQYWLWTYLLPQSPEKVSQGIGKSPQFSPHRRLRNKKQAQPFVVVNPPCRRQRRGGKIAMAESDVKKKIFS